MPKKIRKAYSPTKHASIITEAYVKNLAIRMRLDVDKGIAHGINRKTLAPLQINTKMQSIISSGSFRYTYLLAVWTEAEDGEISLTYDFAYMAVRYNQLSLFEFLTNTHVEMLRTQREKGLKVTCAGWVAIPYDLKIPPVIRDKGDYALATSMVAHDKAVEEITEQLINILNVGV